MPDRAWLKRSFVNSMVASDRNWDVELNPKAQSGPVAPRIVSLVLSEYAVLGYFELLCVNWMVRRVSTLKTPASLTGQ
jgi:hypothetical protein